MPKTKVDFRQFTSFMTKFQQLAHKDKKEFSTATVKDLAARLLAKVKARTPVNKKITWKENNEKGKLVTKVDPNYNGGGTLRRGWTIGSVTKDGDTYSVEVINPVKYASYVEKGHRGVYIPKAGVTLHTDTHWTPGVFMLKISEEELEKDAHGIVEAKLKKFLKKLSR